MCQWALAHEHAHATRSACLLSGSGDLHVEDGCLAREAHFVIPISLHPQVLQQAHLGHPGVTRMKRLLRKSYWWLLLSAQVEELIARCQGCQFSEKSSPPADVLKVAIPRPSAC